MRVIALASQKGGSGKTTLSGHLAVQAEMVGHGPVALIDTDPQGSLAAWWNAREAETPAFARTTLADLCDDLEVLRRAGVGLVVIDTPPAITAAIHEVIQVCDFVVVPTRPSPHDLRAVGATVKLVRRCGKPMVFVVNDATPRARITSEAAIALSQHGTVAPITVHHRTDFATCMIDGRTVMEAKPGSRSAREVIGLWEYLHARLLDEVVEMPFHVHDAAVSDGTGQIAPSKAAAPARPAPALNQTHPREMPSAAAPAGQAPVVRLDDEATFRAMEAVDDAARHRRAPEDVPPSAAPHAGESVRVAVPRPRAVPRTGAVRGFGRRVTGV